MTEKGFEPLTSQLGISGTSYRLQLGLINEKWSSRILKGKDVLDSYVYKDDDIVKDPDGNERPNQNLIVGWVLRTVAIPNINPHQIMKTTQVLVKQAVDNKAKRKVVAAVEDVSKVELEKVPESELKRPKATGWVKEEEAPPADSEAEKRQAFQERMAAKKAEEAAKAATTSTSAPTTTSAPAPASSESPVTTIKTKRKLPSIPGATTTAAPSTAPAAASEEGARDLFCPFCGKDLNWKFCPWCGKPLPHAH